ncbi:MAG: patatin-like phospholipase domain-containing protein 3 [Terrestrivirus sp.]|uniref:Patatin-like phospholipase domain-containing protein 3 n=1 Tax=Terrestrivirus sp. TaxID=2487775 RepID=A0A3G4ZNH8_9VIRU|nr:MAG: patatin-like phospholipase domain-containing protein 3 [Terrestrivirus sp.]
MDIERIPITPYINSIIKKPKISIPEKINISFTGAGLHCLYQFGISGYINKLVKNKYFTINKCYGVSSGSVCAIIFIYAMYNDKSIEQILESYKKIYDLFYKQKLSLAEAAAKCIDESTPDNIHEIVNGKLYLTVARFLPTGIKKESISHFYSKKDLIDCVRVSCSVIYFTDKNLRKWRDGYYFDAFTSIIDTTDKIPTLVIDSPHRVAPFKHQIAPCDNYFDLLVIRGLYDANKVFNHGIKLDTIRWHHDIKDTNNKNDNMLFIVISVVVFIVVLIITLFYK